MRMTNWGEKGMSIIEMIIAIALASVMMLAVYRIFNTQNKVYSGEQKITNMYSNGKVAMEQLSRSLRLAGYDPLEAGNSVFCITNSSFSAASTAALTSNTAIYFTADMDEDGARSAANEYVAFRLNGTDLEQAIISDTSGTIGSWRQVARDITALTFTYTYEDGSQSSGTTNLPDNNVPSRTFEKARVITVTVSARTETVHNLTGTFGSETLTSNIKLRNNTGL